MLLYNKLHDLELLYNKNRYAPDMRRDVKHETAKREYPDIDVYGTAQQRFRFLFREFERNQDD